MRHLLSTGDLTRDEAILILDTARELSQVSERSVKKLPTLRGRTVVNLFYEDSTRTRISFEAAAKRMSADVINFSVRGSSVSKGESLKDTALTLQAMGADGVVIRHSAPGAARRLADWVDGVVINAGDGTHEHPTQALLDAYTMRERLGRIDDLRVAIVGDIRHSRVARSNVLLLNTLGRRGHPRRPTHSAARLRRHLALRGLLRPRRSPAEKRRRNDAAGAGRADELLVLPLHTRIQPPLRPGRRPARANGRPRHRHAPGTHDPRHGNLRGGRRL